MKTKVAFVSFTSSNEIEHYSKLIHQYAYKYLTAIRMHVNQEGMR